RCSLLYRPARAPRSSAVPPSQSFFFPPPAPTEIYTLSLHDALPILTSARSSGMIGQESYDEALPRVSDAATLYLWRRPAFLVARSEEHTSELQSRGHLVCRLLLEKKKTTQTLPPSSTHP